MITEVLIGGQLINLATKCSSNLILSAITTTGSTLVNGMKHISSMDQPWATDVNKKLDDLDIKAKIEVLTALLETLNKKQLDNHIKLALSNVGQSLDNVNKEFDQLKERIDYHNSIYFQNWRTLYCTDLLDNIERHSIKLDKRVSFLLELLKIKV